MEFLTNGHRVDKMSRKGTGSRASEGLDSPFPRREGGEGVRCFSDCVSHRGLARHRVAEIDDPLQLRQFLVHSHLFLTDLFLGEEMG